MVTSKQPDAAATKLSTDAAAMTGDDIVVVDHPETAEPFGWIGERLESLPALLGRRLEELFDREPMIRLEQHTTDDETVIRAEIPGVDPDEDVEISVEGNTLTIAVKRTATEKKETDRSYHSEFRYGSFERSMALPSATDINDIEATYENGILEVRVAKPAAAAARTNVPIKRKD